MSHEEIAYQNKDITSKVLAENFKGKTFRVYGLDLPEIRGVHPTNIPVVKANSHNFCDVQNNLHFVSYILLQSLYNQSFQFFQ